MLEKLPEAIGQALRDRRAGLDKLVFQHAGLRQGMAQIEVKSVAFADHMPIPAPYTADGEGLSPPLQWSGVPADATSVVLIVEDADAPTPQPLVHAIAVDLPAGDGPHGEGALPEGALKSPGNDGDEDVQQGRNSYLRTGWLPPDPPPGHGTHRYAFQVFALAGPPDHFQGKPGRDDVLSAVQAHAIASGCLIGTSARPDGSVKSGEAPQGAAVADGTDAPAIVPGVPPGLAPLG